jgi:hypothetical protein
LTISIARAVTGTFSRQHNLSLQCRYRFRLAHQRKQRSPLIKAKTDNLDVLLSTRTKPADAQHVTIDNASVAVTGTFFQATQPVSLASVPTHGVTGTFWQATTQPQSASRRCRVPQSRGRFFKPRSQ